MQYLYCFGLLTCKHDLGANLGFHSLPGHFQAVSESAKTPAPIPDVSRRSFLSLNREAQSHIKGIEAG